MVRCSSGIVGSSEGPFFTRNADVVRNRSTLVAKCRRTSRTSHSTLIKVHGFFSVSRPPPGPQCMEAETVPLPLQQWACFHTLWALRNSFGQRIKLDHGRQDSDGNRHKCFEDSGPAVFPCRARSETVNFQRSAPSSRASYLHIRSMKGHRCHLPSSTL